jgi:hypothetical protein
MKIRSYVGKPGGNPGLCRNCNLSFRKSERQQRELTTLNLLRTQEEETAMSIRFTAHPNI